jgi:murein L,D-transpeptidase YcbB/YkuD
LAPRGVPHFYEDIYERDARVLAAMRAQPTIDLPK